MTDNKTLNIVVVYPNELDADEMRRIRTAVLTATGEDPRPICPTGSAIIFLANADFDTLRKGIESAKSIGTQLFIAKLEKPYATIGLQPTLAKLQKHLGG